MHQEQSRKAAALELVHMKEKLALEHKISLAMQRIAHVRQMQMIENTLNKLERSIDQQEVQSFKRLSSNDNQGLAENLDNHCIPVPVPSQVAPLLENTAVLNMIQISAVSKCVVQNSININNAGPSTAPQPFIQAPDQPQMQQQSTDQPQPSVEPRKRKRGCLQLLRTKLLKSANTNNGEREVIE